MSRESRQHRLHLVQERQRQCHHHRGGGSSRVPELHPGEELRDAEKSERICKTGSTARVRGNLDVRAVRLAYKRWSHPLKELMDPSFCSRATLRGSMPKASNTLNLSHLLPSRTDLPCLCFVLQIKLWAIKSECAAWKSAWQRVVLHY